MCTRREEEAESASLFSVLSLKLIGRREEAALSCHTTPSRPRSTITWYSRAGVLQATSTVHSQAVFGGTITRSELTIRATADDNGRVVTCVAQNGLGSSVNVNITVSVLHGPVWVKVPSGRLDFLEGGDLVLTAVAAANPPTVSYSWWRGPEMIIGEGISEDGTGALRLNRIHRNQQGNYSVSAHTSRGTAHSDFFINVQYGPEDVVAATRVTLDKGGTTSVICSAKGNPTPNITWTRSNDNTSVLWWGVGEARLVVERASKEDTGVYLCKASNSVTTAPPAVTALVVTQPPTTPKEYQSVRGWAAIGGNGYLKCHVTAAPTPTFSWSVNGEAFVPNKSKYFVHHPELTDGVALWISVLEVRRVTDRDYTSYTCKAHNTEGEHSLSLTLGPPLPPQAPYNLTATVVTTSAVLSWRHSQPEDSVQGYTVKYHPVDSKEYKFQDVPGRGGTAATIKGLIASTQYAFAVQAYSEQGRSLYSAPFYVTTMRDAVEEAASSSTSTGSSNTGSGTQHRVPRLILIIICLTGAALLILNIVVVTCFLRSERAPSTSFDIATTATTPGSATCVDLVSSDDGSSVARLIIR
ncbi:putative nephrin-like protein [Penaeus vannamei]|uniref:Putative nephrin-like protein n=1 Tax=Penaeus vannamei TaxID=6689 RepID=A0A423TUX2_PENVA|nr:putative nephrin-like protein [Penaeus vannamei]